MSQLVRIAIIDCVVSIVSQKRFIFQTLVNGKRCKSEMDFLGFSFLCILTILLEIITACFPHKCYCPDIVTVVTSNSQIKLNKIKFSTRIKNPGLKICMKYVIL